MLLGLRQQQRLPVLSPGPFLPVYVYNRLFNACIFLRSIILLLNTFVSINSQEELKKKWTILTVLLLLIVVFLFKTL